MGAAQSAQLEMCCASRRRKKVEDGFGTENQDSHRMLTSHKVSIALLGNSILYYNDLPRLLEAFGHGALEHPMSGALEDGIEQDSCLRGGVGFGQLLAKGNGMTAKFATDDKGAPDVASLLSRPWDFVVMNDYTQSPARAASRRASIDVLTTQLGPLLRRSGGAPVLLETWAYRAHTKGSDDLGDHAEFTARLQVGGMHRHAQGTHAYARARNAGGLPRVCVGTGCGAPA